MASFNQRLKELRIKRELSQQALANHTGISKSSINMYERGEREPGFETIEILADFFKVDLNYLLGKSDYYQISEMPIGKKIKYFRKTNALSLGTLSELTDIPIHTLYKYEEDDPANVTISTQKIKTIANALGIEPALLAGWDISESITNKRNGISVPVFGSVAAGIPIEAITDIEDYEEITEDMASTGEFAALKIKGRSMEPRFTEGDVVIVRLQNTIESGDIAVVIVNGDEATCKKIKKTPEGVMLISTNPDFEPMFYTNKEIEEKPVRIWGKVVELRAKF